MEAFQWEYDYVPVRVSNTNEHGDNGQMGRTFDELNKYGAKGWELIQLVPSGLFDPMTHIAVFKRKYTKQ